MNYDQIIVLDYGSQYNQLIARRIREFGVYSALYPHTVSFEEISALPNVKGIILSGGPNSVYQTDAFGIDERILTSGLPILGICYGMQLICHKLGGSIQPASKREYGKAEITVNQNADLFNGLPQSFSVFMSHGDQVEELPEGFFVDAKSDTCPNAAISHPTKKLYGVQFHPEVRHSEFGLDLLERFVFSVCEARKNWSMANYIEEQVKSIKREVGEKRVLCGISGGVDSAVTAALIHRAIGDQLTCLFINHGLLRQGEEDQVMDTLGKDLGIPIQLIDASDRFLSLLKGVIDPEQKRKMIGHEFIAVFNDEAKELGSFDYLAQGTLYTDIIESGTATAQTIKSHHNVGGLPKDLPFQLLEPLKSLFKDEVRRLGEELGLPHDLVWRQPFPGPGLAIRIIGDITEAKLSLVRQSDAILREEVRNAGLNESIWQYFTVLTNIKTVGVMGDGRTYDYTVGIRAVTSIDGMTADWAKMPWEVLDKISRRIVNEVRGINRVVYDITSKPPGTIEWE